MLSISTDALFTEVIEITFDGENAKGTVKLEESEYGIYLSVNGRCIGLLDLYYFSPQAECEGKAQHVNLVLFHDAMTGEDPLAYVRWYDDKTTVENESWCRIKSERERAVLEWRREQEDYYRD